MQGLFLVNVRRIPWVEVKESSTKTSFIGKGTFAKCYFAQMGSMNVCIKVLSINVKYRCLFYSEAKILSLICHNNLPWLHALSDDSDKIAIIMTFHFYLTGKSLSVYDALLKHCSDNMLLDTNRFFLDVLLLSYTFSLSIFCIMTLKQIMYSLNQPRLVFELYLLTSIKHACPVMLNCTNCHPKKRKNTPSTILK